MSSQLVPTVPFRSHPYDDRPEFRAESGLWLFGNVRILRTNLALIPLALGSRIRSDAELKSIELDAEHLVLSGHTLVSGIHSDVHRRVAIVPLRWGSPRVLVLSGGFRYHLGQDLTDEPFRAARLWRHRFDPLVDLVISRRAPDKLPTYASHNPSVDRLIKNIVQRTVNDPLFEETH